MQNALMQVMRRTLAYATIGAVLALGAPLGWLVIDAGGPGRLNHAPQLLRANPALYLYMAVCTAAVFAAFGAFLGRRWDVLAQHDREVEALARTDVLTGLSNVRAFRDALARESARALRAGAPLAVVMVDLDHFKRVNDTYGHATGDEVLAHASRVLAASVRSGDLVARVGGEEFALLCPGADAAEAARIAERARSALEAQPVVVGGARVTITASFGVAARRGRPAELLGAADAALYEAKRTGRNRVLTAA